jgi:hypothetical protein
VRLQVVCLAKFKKTGRGAFVRFTPLFLPTEESIRGKGHTVGLPDALSFATGLHCRSCVCKRDVIVSTVRLRSCAGEHNVVVAYVQAHANEAIKGRLHTLGEEK